MKFSKITASALAFALLLPGLALAKETKLSGTITSITGNTFVFTAKKGASYTADATNAKLLRKYGGESKLSEFQVKDSIDVKGTLTGTNIAATEIKNNSIQAKNAEFQGKITAVSGTTFTMETSARGNQLINTDSSTTYKDNGKDSKFSDLSAGLTVKVSGVWDRTNSNVTAKTVNIVRKNIPITFRGNLTAKTDTTLTITAKDKTYTVDISKAKLFRRFGGRMATADFKIGDKIQVVGKYLAGSTNVNALLVRDISIIKKPSPSPSASPSASASPSPSSQ